MRTVRRHPDFEADFVAHLEWLVARRERGWIEALGAGVEEVGLLLSMFPAAGALVLTRGTIQLRKLVLRKVPFLAWYVLDEAREDDDLWLVRLFHARQRRPKPDLRTWLR